jgi:hypothetical protein
LVAITAPLMKKNDGMDKNERIASRRRFSWSADQAVQMILEMRTLKPDEQLAHDVEMDPSDKLETTARTGADGIVMTRINN